MLHLEFSLDNQSVNESLVAIATKLKTKYQKEFGTTYKVGELKSVLAGWLELSVEQLLEDAIFHVDEGDCAMAFNRDAFNRLLSKATPVAESNDATAA
jgi:hypothetical protein